MRYHPQFLCSPGGGCLAPLQLGSPYAAASYLETEATRFMVHAMFAVYFSLPHKLSRQVPRHGSLYTIFCSISTYQLHAFSILCIWHVVLPETGAAMLTACCCAAAAKQERREGSLSVENTKPSLPSRYLQFERGPTHPLNCCPHLQQKVRPEPPTPQ